MSVTRIGVCFPEPGPAIRHIGAIVAEQLDKLGVDVLELALFRDHHHAKRSIFG